MVKRTIIGKSEGERLVDLLKGAREAAKSGSTRPAGNKVLEDDEDFYWTRPDGAESSARQVEQDLDSAQARIDEAEDSLAASQVRLEAAEAEVEAVRDDLTTVETVTLPSAVAALEAADAAAAEELGQLDGKLATAQADLAQAETDLTQLSSDLAAAEEDRAQAAQQVADDMATLDSSLATAQADLEAAEGEINSLHADLSAEIVAREAAVQDVAADLGTLDGKLTTAFPSGEFDVAAELAQTIRSSVIQYAVGSSETTAPTSGWSATSPTRTPGSFIWFRTVITYADDSTSTSAAALLTGNAGEPGPAGADGTGVTIKGSFDTAAELPATGADGDAYLVAGDLYVWDSAASDWENVGRIQGPEGPPGDPGDPGSPGDPGISVSSITPYFRRLAKGASTPAKPTTMTPTGWNSTEPAWLPDTELYRVERIVYSSGQFAYTSVTKVAVFAGIDAAMATANGKNKVTYADFAASSKPGPDPAIDPSRAAGDIHRNRNQSTGEIWAEWQWTGNAWQQVQFGNEVLTSLDVGKLTAGTANIQTGVIDQLWVDGLVGKAAVFNQISVAAGNILIDPNGLNPQLRNNIGGPAWTWNEGGKYWRRDAVRGGTSQFNAYANVGSVYDSNLLDPGAMYVIKYDVWVDSIGPSTQTRASIYYRRQDGTTAFVGDGNEPGGDSAQYSPVVAGQWNSITRYWRAPADAQSGGINFQLVFGGENSTEVRIRNPFVGKQAASVLIEDGAINAQKVNAESVGAAVGQFVKAEVGELVATKGTVGEAVIDKLWADGIYAKAIEAARIAVAPDNVFPDPLFMDEDAWGGVANGSYLGSPSNRLTLTPAKVGQYFKGLYSRTVKVEPGATYRVRAGLRFGGSGDITHVYFHVRGDKPDGGAYSVGANIARSEATNYKEAYDETEITIPSDSSEWVTMGWFIATTATSGAVEIWDVTAQLKVGAVLIENGAVNADKINAQSVAGAVGQFLELTTNQITAGTATIDSAVINKLWADGIATKALTASRLTVSPSNMLAGVQAWGLETLDEATDAWRDFGRNPSDPSRWAQGTVTHVVHQPIEFVAGQSYRMSVDVKGSIAGTVFFVQLTKSDAAGNEIAGNIPTTGSSSGYIFSGETVGGTDWSTFTNSFTPTTSGVGALKVYTNHSSGSSTSTTFQWFRNPVLRPMTGSVLIENGAISTPKLNVTSDMSAAIVNAMTLNTKKLVVTEEAVLQHATLLGQTVVDDINVNGKIIGTDGVFTGTVDFANVNVTGLQIVNKLAANTISADKIAGGSFSGKVFTGGEFRTSSSPTTTGGVILGGSRGLGIWDSNGNSTFSVKPETGDVNIRGELSSSSVAGHRVRVGPDAYLAPNVVAPGGKPQPGIQFYVPGGNGRRAQIGGSKEALSSEITNVDILGVDGNGEVLNGKASIGETGVEFSAGGTSSDRSSFRLSGSTIAANVRSGDYPSDSFYLTPSQFTLRHPSGVTVDSDIHGKGRFDVDGAFAIGGNGGISGALYYYGASPASGSGNLVMSTSGGKINVVGSSRRYKKNIVDWNPSVEAVLSLQPRQWQHNEKTADPDIDERWYVGFVAEEVDELGLKGLVQYGPDGQGGWRPEALNYDRFAAAHQVVLQKHEQELSELRAENDDLRTRLERLEALLTTQETE